MKFKTIDVFKFIFAFCVIAIHVKPEMYSGYAVKLILNQIFDLAVPFFFIASGYLLASRFNEDPENNQTIIRKHCKKVLFLYLKWEAIYFPLSLYGMLKSDETLANTIIDFIRRLIFVGEEYNSWHLWYLLASVYAFGILIILAKKPYSKMISVLSVLAIAALIVALYVDAIRNTDQSMLHGLNIISRGVIDNTIISSRVLLGFVYIPVGMILFTYSMNVFASGALFVVFFVLDLFINDILISDFLLILYCICLFELVIRIRTKFDNTLLLRQISSSVYFIHMYVWTIIYMVIYHKQTFGLAIFIKVSIVSLLVSYFWHIYQNKRLSKKS